MKQKRTARHKKRREKKGNNYKANIGHREEDPHDLRGAVKESKTTTEEVETAKAIDGNRPRRDNRIRDLRGG